MDGVRCTRCGERKDAAQYHANNARKGGLYCWCKACVSAHQRARKYRLTEADLDAHMLIPECQNPGCRQKFQAGDEGARKMNFDHCHTNLHLRGVLCPLCNRAAVGEVYENIARLRGLIQYLRDSEERRRERATACSSP